jgi:hypothetical protein
VLISSDRNARSVLAVLEKLRLALTETRHLAVARMARKPYMDIRLKRLYSRQRRISITNQLFGRLGLLAAP